MSKQIVDERIVEMKFDNADFQKKTAETMSTVQELKKSLNFDGGNSLKNVTAAVSSFSTAGMVNSVEAVTAKFSALQVVGITVISELTRAAMGFANKVWSSTLGQIRAGGMKRALNIEQAKFQLKGLGVEWSQIEDDINYGVKDTAYGLDAAAKAASQLTASGVELGDEMKAALRGISGVAAMTNATYEEISPIFTTVAGQGKLMTMQLRQLEARGLNAAATIGKAMGKTEAEIRDMVSKGEIDFKTFAKAMDDSFGQHAKDANKTFEGAMSNVRAALSRTGAMFAGPYMESARLVFVDLIGLINGFNKALQGTENQSISIVKDVTMVMDNVQKKISAFVKSEDLLAGLKNIISAVHYEFYALMLVLEPIKRGFREIFPSSGLPGFRQATAAISEFFEHLVITDEHADQLKRTMKGVFAVFKMFGTIVKQVLRALSPVTDIFGKGVSTLLKYTAKLGDTLVAYSELIEKNGLVFNATSKVVGVFEKLFEVLKSITGGVGSTFSRWLQSISDAVKGFKFEGLASGISKVLVGAVNIIGNVVGAVVSNIKKIFVKGGDDINDTLISIISTGAMVYIVKASNFFRETLKMFKDIKNLEGLKIVFTNITTTLKQFQSDLKADVLLRLAKAIGVITVSMLLLASIDSDKLLQSVITIGVLAKILTAAMDKFALIANAVTKASPVKVVEQLAVFATMGAVFRQVATSLTILAIGLKILSTIPVDKLLVSVLAVKVLIKELTASIKMLSASSMGITKGTASLIAMAVAVDLLAVAVKKMSDIPFEGLMKGMLGTVILLKELTKSALLLSNIDTKVVKGTTAMIAMAGALLLLTKSVEVLSKLQLADLAKGIGSVVVMMYSLTGAMILMSKFGGKGMLTTSVALIAMASALNVMSDVALKFKDLSLEQLAKGIGSLVAVMASAGATLALVSKLGGSAVSLVATAVAFTLVASAMDKFADVIIKLGNTSLQTIIVGFVTLAGVLIGIGAASAVLAPLVPVMLGLGAALFLVGSGAMMLSAALTTLSVAGPAAIGSLILMLSEIIAAIPVMLASLISALTASLSSLKGLVKIFVQLVVEGLHEILVGLQTLVPDVIKLLEITINAVLDFLERSIGPIVEKAVKIGINLIYGLANGIDEHGGEVVDAIFKVIESIFKALGKAAIDIVKKGWDLARGLAKGISEKTSGVVNKAKEMVEKAKNKAAEYVGGFKSVGNSAGSKFVAGIASFIGKAMDIAKNLVNSAVDAAQAEIDNASLDTSNISNQVESAAQTASDVANQAVSATNAQTSAQTKQNNVLNTAQAYMAKYAGAAATCTAAQMAQAAGARQNAAYTTKASSAMDSYSKNTKKAGGSAKAAKTPIEELTDTIKNSIKVFDNFNSVTASNPFEKFSEGDIIKPDAMLDNMRNVTKTTSGWIDGLNRLVKRGVSDKLIKYLEDLGVEGRYKVQAFIDMTDEQLKEAEALFQKSMNPEANAKLMLDGMRDSLNAVKEWSINMQTLATRGIQQGLLEELGKLGPAGADKVKAFASMTDEEIQQANAMFAESLMLPESTAGMLLDSYQTAGLMGVAGLTAGLNDHGSADNAAFQMGIDVVDNLNTALDEHSPSKKTMKSGRFAGMGLANGLESCIGMVNLACMALANNMVFTLNTWMPPSRFYTLGANAMQGLVNGINAKGAEAINAARSIAQQVKNIIATEWDEHSPSRVMRKLAQFFIKGGVIGMKETAHNMYEAAKSVADGTVNEMDSMGGRIEEMLNWKYNPVITPVLDLSVVRSQLSEVNGMFTSGKIGVNAGVQNGEQFAGAIPNQQISFTQNNYSPKALSRYEINRDTKNSLRQMEALLKR